MTAARDFGFICRYARLRFGSKQLAERLSACQIFSALTRGAGKVELAFRHFFQWTLYTVTFILCLRKCTCIWQGASNNLFRCCQGDLGKLTLNLLKLLVGDAVDNSEQHLVHCERGTCCFNFCISVDIIGITAQLSCLHNLFYFIIHLSQ